MSSLKCYNVTFKVKYTVDIEVLAEDEDEAIQEAEKIAEAWHEKADYVDFDDIQQITNDNYFDEG